VSKLISPLSTLPQRFLLGPGPFVGLTRSIGRSLNWLSNSRRCSLSKKCPSAPRVPSVSKIVVGQFQPCLHGALLVHRDKTEWVYHVVECISRSAVPLVALPVLRLALFGAISNSLAFTADLELLLLVRQLDVQFPTCLARLSIPVVFGCQGGKLGWKKPGRFTYCTFSSAIRSRVSVRPRVERSHGVPSFLYSSSMSWNWAAPSARKPRSARGKV
jgi:hypothetical protein